MSNFATVEAGLALGRADSVAVAGNVTLVATHLFASFSITSASASTTISSAPLASAALVVWRGALLEVAPFDGKNVDFLPLWRRWSGWCCRDQCHVCRALHDPFSVCGQKDLANR
jgi:hypothetical protein